MKKILFISLFFIFFFNISDAIAASSALDTLVNNVMSLTRSLNVASSKLMLYGRMLWCNAMHGEGSYFHFKYEEIVNVTISIVDIYIVFSSMILYALGFCILLVASFYMFDVAFHISVAMVLLPLGFALYPFGWTKDKLKLVIEMILYYTGVFIFLPLGVKLGVELVNQVMAHGFSGGDNFNFEQALIDDDTEGIRNHFSIISLAFWGIFLCYIVAIRTIPLMADEFCKHFFGESLTGGGISQQINNGIKKVKEHTVDKAKQYAKDVAQHKIGKSIQERHAGKSGFINRAMARYGKQLADTRGGNNNRI